MKTGFWYSALFCVLASSFALGQNSCPIFLVDKPMVVNIEGHFVNAKNSRSTIYTEWRHHPESLDTFFVHLSNNRDFNFVTAGAYRYMEFPDAKIKRQLGLHHLKDNIGETPLKLDDMELLANGQFFCNDSTDKRKNIFSTAMSNMWYSMIADELPKPKQVTMKGSRKEFRTFYIRQWKNYNGEALPTLVRLESSNYSGELWIRSAYPMQALESDPLKKNVDKKQKFEEPDLFKKIFVKGERKIPLILKLNQELLRE
ncbi:MAG: hypothetical protein HUK20_07540 [Fibrobacter sp.]|nr:hypothetical protein [Fibrobacter sp.]